jgi:hypothetical protein
MIQRIILAAIVWMVMGVGVAVADPTLQLDITPGYYVGKPEETIFSRGNIFTLYAYLIPDSKAPLGDTYYISAALVPQSQAHGGLGSFSFAGTTVDVTDMTYGTPPIPSHGVFNTLFSEFSFKFAQDNRSLAYNTADFPGLGPTPSSAGTMYYRAFDVDVSGLASGQTLHFDLYSRLDHGRQFAPFSHDAAAQSAVPEPGTLGLLLGAGLIALAAKTLPRRVRRTRSSE